MRSSRGREERKTAEPELMLGKKILKAFGKVTNVYVFIC